MDKDYFHGELERLKDAGLYRRPRLLESPVSQYVLVSAEKKVVFCSNNYLNLAGDPRIHNAVKKGLDEWGFGSGGSRLICGHQSPHERLEKRLAEFLGKEAALVLPTGYQTNNAVLSTLPGKGDLVAIDKLVHASIIDGARASAAELRVWLHNRPDKLRKLLDKGGYHRVFIVTDSLFSMDGDLAQLDALVKIKREYDAVLVVDEAHAFGCLGPEGRGWAAACGLLEAVDVYIGTFSKALGGSGGFVASSRAAIEYLINKGRGFIFSTAIPAVNCIAAEAALDIIEHEPQRRERLIENGEMFRRLCRKKGLNIGESESYIIPVIIGDSKKTVSLAERLWEAGFWAPAIRPPTVAPGSSRLRVSLMSEHTREDIEGLIEHLTANARE